MGRWPRATVEAGHRIAGEGPTRSRPGGHPVQSDRPGHPAGGVTEQHRNLTVEEEQRTPRRQSPRGGVPLVRWDGDWPFTPPMVTVRYRCGLHPGRRICPISRRFSWRRRAVLQDAKTCSRMPDALQGAKAAGKTGADIVPFQQNRRRGDCQSRIRRRGVQHRRHRSDQWQQRGSDRSRRFQSRRQPPARSTPISSARKIRRPDSYALPRPIFQFALHPARHPRRGHAGRGLSGGDGVLRAAAGHADRRSARRLGQSQGARRSAEAIAGLDDLGLAGHRGAQRRALLSARRWKPTR